jgi:alkaline phosphatase D
MTCYDTVREVHRDFFIHCGDTMSADGPRRDEVDTDAYGIWRNALLDEVPEKRKLWRD